MTEIALKTVNVGGELSRLRRILSLVGLLRAVALIGLLAWSAKWLPPMASMVAEQTAIGQHGLHGLPSGHEVFELIFVAAHCGVRWLPGVLAALGLFWISGRVGRAR